MEAAEIFKKLYGKKEYDKISNNLLKIYHLSCKVLSYINPDIDNKHRNEMASGIWNAFACYGIKTKMESIGETTNNIMNAVDLWHEFPIYPFPEQEEK